VRCEVRGAMRTWIFLLAGARAWPRLPSEDQNGYSVRSNKMRHNEMWGICRRLLNEKMLRGLGL
jgi:hypothetical protein